MRGSQLQIDYQHLLQVRLGVGLRLKLADGRHSRLAMLIKKIHHRATPCVEVHVFDGSGINLEYMPNGNELPFHDKIAHRTIAMKFR